MATRAHKARPAGALVGYAGGDWVRLLAIGLLTGVYVVLASIPIVTLLAAAAAGRAFIWGAVTEHHSVAPRAFLQALSVGLRKSWRSAIASVVIALLSVVYLLLLVSPEVDLGLKAAAGAGLVVLLGFVGVYAIFADSGQAPWGTWAGWVKQLFFFPAQGMLLVMAVMSAVAIGGLAPALIPFIWGLVIFGCAVLRFEYDARVTELENNVSVTCAEMV